MTRTERLIAENERYADELQTWLWTHSRAGNPVGYADRERELELTVRRLEQLRDVAENPAILAGE